MHVTISTIFSFISVIDSETGEWNGAPNFNVCGKKLTATAFFPVFRVYGIAPSSMCVVGQYMLHMGVALVSALTYHSQTLHISSDPQHIYSCGETCSVVNILEFRACHHVINCSPPSYLAHLCELQGKLVPPEPMSAANTPYRLMMRHLLGGSYSSPRPEHEALHHPDSCAAATATLGAALGAASSDFHARDSLSVLHSTSGIIHFELDSASAGSAGGSPGIPCGLGSYSTASSEAPSSPGCSHVSASPSVSGSSPTLAPSGPGAYSPESAASLGSSGVVQSPSSPSSPDNAGDSVPPVGTTLRLEWGAAAVYPAAALSPLALSSAAQPPAVRTTCSRLIDNTLALSPGSWAGTPTYGEHGPPLACIVCAW